MADRVPYRRLPGYRRGFLRRSSAWLGPDHLLLVRSMRFREEYKRYYFQDIQALVVTERPRFYLSTRDSLIGLLWLLVFLLSSRFPNGRAVTGSVGIALVMAWAYISGTCSCTCRIYTAVSRDNLPSVYRTWTARKFLRAVEPYIAKAQGVLESADSSAAALQNIGPVESPAPTNAAATLEVEAATPHTRGRGVSFWLLLAALFVDALRHWLAFYYEVLWTPRVTYLLPLLVMAAAIFVLVQYHWKKVSPAQQKLAIGVLVAMGLTYYGAIVAAGAIQGIRAAASNQAVTYRPPDMRIISEIEFGITLALGLIGLGVAFTGRDSLDDPEGLAL